MELLPDRSEKVPYDYPGYDIYIRRDLLSHFPDYRAESHWHGDLEFMYILSGTMLYQINEETVVLPPGSGILVNRRQFHFGFSRTMEECAFICVLVRPELLSSTKEVEREYVLPILTSGPPYVLLNDDHPWQREILADIRRIYDHRGEDGAPLYLQGILSHLWLTLWKNLPRSLPGRKPDHRLDMVKSMVSFIHKNYPEKLQLSHIAAAGNISKSTCLQLFKRYLHDTPGNYLIRYRLEKAAFLLRSTDRTISDIAVSVGFSTTSYFAEMFHRFYGSTPKQYRANP